MAYSSTSMVSTGKCISEFEMPIGDTGTIIDSTDAIVKHWHTLGNEMGIDPSVILQTSHGRRSIDVLKIYDPSRANSECKFGARYPLD